MAHEDRHAHASGRHLDLRIDDLLRLRHHLPLFLGGPVLHEDVDMRDDVERDLLLELVDRHIRRRVVDRLGLIPKLVDPFLARAADRLVGADDHPLDRRAIVQRLQRHDHLRGRAVGVGDDIAVLHHLDRLRVHLRHDQRNVRLIAIERRVVDHHAARLGGLGRIDLGRVRADGEKRHVPAAEIERVQVLGLECLLAIADFGAQRFSARQSHDLIGGKLALGQDVQHFAAHVTGGADDSDAIAHFDLLWFGDGGV